MARSLLAVVAALMLGAAPRPPANPQTLSPATSRDPNVVHRWVLPGDPHGIAVGKDGTIYVGLAKPQAVVAIDGQSGNVIRRVVLDSAEIASTKELVTLRIGPDGKQLYIANGSDESATILSLPSLGVVREITIEGEAIRDALPDPSGRYLYLLGRRVHVYDAKGENELHTLPFEDPMAIAANRSWLAVVAPDDSGSVKQTAVALYDTETFRELSRASLRSSNSVFAALFGPDDHRLLMMTGRGLVEKRLDAGAAPRFSAMIDSVAACPAPSAGPQAIHFLPDGRLAFVARECAGSDSANQDSARFDTALLPAVEGDAISYDARANEVVTTERSGFLTCYRVPVRAPR